MARPIRNPRPRQAAEGRRAGSSGARREYRPNRRKQNPGASDAAIAAAAQRLGFDFPPDLRDLYRRHDGQNANKGALIGREGAKLYPLKKVTNASHPRLTERHLIIGGGKGDSRTTWLLTYDKKTGALELFAPDLDR